MELLEFKEYLNKRVKELLKQLKEIEQEISSLPEIKNFDILKYGTKKEILQKYYNSRPKRRFKILIKPTNHTLQEFVRNMALKELESAKKSLEDQINELLNAYSKMFANGVIEEIYPIKNTINELLTYCVKNKVPVNEFLTIFSTLIRNINSDKNAVDKVMLNNLSVYFDENGELYPNFQAHTLIFIIKKLFSLFNINNSDIETKNYLNNLYNYINNLANKEPLSKEELARQKENLAKINSYIKGDTIIKIPEDLDEFNKLLILSGLKAEQISFYKEKMKSAVAAEKKHSSDTELQEVMVKYLSNDDFNTLKVAENLILSIEDIEMKSLLARLREDVISLCKYLVLVTGSNEEQETIEFITQKLTALKISISNAKDPHAIKTNSFYYLVNSNHLPRLISALEVIDITFYEEIYKLLTDLSNNVVSGTKISEQEGIEIYSLRGNSAKIIYTKKGTEIIIVSIKIKNRSQSNETLISPKDFDDIKTLYNTPKTESFKKLHETYETLILSQLDLTKECSNLTFHPPIE